MIMRQSCRDIQQCNQTELIYPGSFRFQYGEQKKKFKIQVNRYIKITDINLNKQVHSEGTEGVISN